MYALQIQNTSESDLCRMKQLKQLQRKPRKKNSVASRGFKPQRLVCTYVQRKHFWLCSRQPWTSQTQCLYARWISSLSLMLLQDTDLLNEEDNREKLNWILFSYNNRYQSISAPSIPSLCPEMADVHTSEMLVKCSNILSYLAISLCMHIWAKEMVGFGENFH